MANAGLQKGDEISVFMLGKGVTYEAVGGDDFDVVSQVNQFTEEGDFYVWGVCLQAHGLVASASCPVAWMDDLYELSMEADKVFTF
jgi:hypothetical protein